MDRRVLRIGTRGSLLALTQSGFIQRRIEEAWPDVKVELTVIKTTGDKIQDVPLAKVGGKGLFVKEIEEALLAREVDLAVHSMKDVPAVLPGGLIIGVVPAREDPRDVLVTHKGSGLTDLPPAARVGSSSLRRAAQIRAHRPDILVENLRGNLDTRLRKLDDGMYDAIVLAAAGLHRMGWQDRITAYLEVEDFLPAVGQGALGLELREDDHEVRELLAPLHDQETSIAVQAERSFLETLEGGCQVPIGGHARAVGDRLELTGLVASVDGSKIFRITRTAPRDEAVRLGIQVAGELLEAGARSILDEVNRGLSC
ncbi:MAG: hydroxymethylbilane synthase [Syntrophobacteraceae bacterium]|nr:hydroxymethylbilane synthase [Syntrophobacteraceae bacterium]